MTLRSETETETETPDGADADAVRVEVRGVKVETWEGPSSSALALSVGVQDVEAWLVMGPMDDESGKDSSGTRMNRVRAVWRRNDSQLGDSNGPVVKVTQRRTTPGSDTEDSNGVQPVEVVVAPLAIIAHSRVAATLAAFPQEIPGSHFSRVLSSVRGLRGDSFVERSGARDDVHRPRTSSPAVETRVEPPTVPTSVRALVE